ncbi:MAG: PadR family transcriptional regulator [Acidobacteria bacterium]|nr:PadR family transcriptional regulator [Acidobacteriota bacterium]
MQRNRPLSPQAATVLQALAAPHGWQYGYHLCQITSLKAGTMYPILIRLAARGLLETAWEDSPPQGRPPRHLYRLTPAGLRLAAALEAAPPQPVKAARARLRPAWGAAR